MSALPPQERAEKRDEERDPTALDADAVGAEKQHSKQRSDRLKAHGFRLLGYLLLALGFVGVWLPVLPTTIFFIGAVACFARSSPRLQHYLLNHPKFGPPLCDWFDEGAIGNTGKVAALFGMGIGMIIVIITVDSLFFIGLAAIMLMASGWFVMSRPLPERERDEEP